MVLLHIKRGEESQFLYETTTAVPVKDLVAEVAAIYNTRLRIDRLCMEADQLAEHGLMKPPEMQGLTDEQVEELHLVDTWAARCYPSGGAVSNTDPIGRRAGNAPLPALGEVIGRTLSEAAAAISKDQVARNVPLTMALLQEALDKVKGACMIVYPMGLPPHEEVGAILADTEDLSGKQAAKMVIEAAEAQLWWAGKELLASKKLGDFIGKNEKTKIIAKIQKRGAGAPSREPLVDEATQKLMMAEAYKKQEEMKKLAEADEDSYLNAAWANPGALKASLQGTGAIGWKPR